MADKEQEEKEFKLTDLIDSIPKTSEDLERSLFAHKLKNGKILVAEERRFSSEQNHCSHIYEKLENMSEKPVSVPPGIKTGVYDSVEQIQKAYGTLQFAIDIAKTNLQALEK